MADLSITTTDYFKTDDAVAASNIAFTFPFIELTDIKVYLDGVLMTSGYTVNGNAADNFGYQSGDVDFAPAVTGHVIIMRQTALATQYQNIPQYGLWSIDDINLNLARTVMHMIEFESPAKLADPNAEPLQFDTTGATDDGVVHWSVDSFELRGNTSDKSITIENTGSKYVHWESWHFNAAYQGSRGSQAPTTPLVLPMQVSPGSYTHTHFRLCAHWESESNEYLEHYLMLEGMVDASTNIFNGTVRHYTQAK